MRIERGYLKIGTARVHRVRQTDQVRCTGCLNIIYDVICMTNNKYLTVHRAMYLLGPYCNHIDEQVCSS